MPPASPGKRPTNVTGAPSAEAIERARWAALRELGHWVVPLYGRNDPDYLGCSCGWEPSRRWLVETQWRRLGQHLDVALEVAWAVPLDDGS